MGGDGERYKELVKAQSNDNGGSLQHLESGQGENTPERCKMVACFVCIIIILYNSTLNSKFYQLQCSTARANGILCHLHTCRPSLPVEIRFYVRMRDW